MRKIIAYILPTFIKKLIKKIIIQIKFLSKLIKKIIIQIKFLLIKNPEGIVSHHFSIHSSKDHENYAMFNYIFSTLEGKPLNIFETGSSAWGTNSSILFDSYIRKFGGTFTTVDIRPEPSYELKNILSKNSKTVIEDSVKFIDEYKKTYFENLDLIYLDSFDLDLNNPEPSMNHGYKEFSLLDKKIRNGCIIIIDDTPCDLNYFDSDIISNQDFSFIPGKGTLILNEIKESNNYEILFHEYALVIKKIN